MKQSTRKILAFILPFPILMSVLAVALVIAFPDAKSPLLALALILPFIGIFGVETFLLIAFAFACCWLLSIGLIFAFHLLPYFYERTWASVMAGLTAYVGLAFLFTYQVLKHSF